MAIGIPIIGEVITAVKDLVGEAIVDKDKRIEINYKLQELENKAQDRLHAELMAQAEINKEEAKHTSIFVSGWRPFIGWVSGIGVGWTFVLSPIVEWGSRINGWTGQMPELDTGQLMALVTAMLGVAGYRTFEKVKGVETTSLTRSETPASGTTTVKVQGEPNAEVTIDSSSSVGGTEAPKKKSRSIFKKIGRLV